MKLFKKITLGFFAVLLITSCVTESISKQETSSETFSTKIDLKTVDVSQFQNPIYLEGEFKHWVNENNEFVVFTQTADQKLLFILQGVEKDFNFKGTIESLLFLDDFFLITTSGGTASFGADQELVKMVMEQNKVSTSIMQVDGFGVVHNWISPENEFYETVTVESLKARNSVFHKQEYIPTEDCDSGGAGSSSCSISTGTGTGCSVSCDDGYYACCSQTVMGPDDCHCSKG